jgi:hypothetical protein
VELERKKYIALKEELELPAWERRDGWKRAVPGSEEQRQLELRSEIKHCVEQRYLASELKTE